MHEHDRKMTRQLARIGRFPFICDVGDSVGRGLQRTSVGSLHRNGIISALARVGCGQAIKETIH